MKPRLIVGEDFVAAAVEQVVLARPHTLALSGGKTPQPVHRALAIASLPWVETDVFMVDERCVPFDHPDSNFGAAYRDLLSRVPARVHPPPAPACEASAYEAELARVFGADLPRFDLVLLGLGEDGHTASLFPDDPALRVTDRWVVTVARPDHPRLTLTLPVLSAARRALFLVRGASKAEALARLLDGDESIPAARVAAEAVLVVADLEAARATRTGAASVH